MKADYRLTVLIDMDDTIEYLLREWIDYLNQKHGTHVTEDDVHAYDLTLAFPELSLQDVYEPLYDPELWRRVKPVPGAQYAIERMMVDGCDVYIVTSSNFATIYTKIQSVIRNYFPTINDDHIIIARKKQMIRGDIMIDDAPHNLIGGEYLKIMPTAAHNRDFDANANGIIRAESWNEIYEIVRDYGKLLEGIEDVKHEELGEIIYCSVEGACELLHMRPETLYHQIERWITELAFLDTESK